MPSEAALSKSDAVVRAAGAVLWRATGGDVEVALVHRPRYDDWSLPKGKLDKGEAVPTAAVREVREETGYACVLDHPLLETSYTVTRNGVEQPKTVQYFSARCAEGAFEPNDEVDELRWVPLSQARAAVSHDTDAAVLDRFEELGTDLTTILLARHAKAVDKSTWDGDDDLRPLTDAGVRQASAMRSVVELFGPDQVHSAPRLRCVQTVRPLAESLELKVVHEPALTEAAFSASPSDAVERLSALATEGGRRVICSQGGVIPGVVDELARHSDLALDDVVSKKGSIWVLSFTDGRLASAHYIPPPSV